MADQDDSCSPLIDVVHENRAAARNIADQLDRLAVAFDLVGNSSVADRLAVIAADIERQADRLSRAYGRDLTERLHDSKQATMNMVSGVLAGITIGSGKAPEAAIPAALSPLEPSVSTPSQMGGN
jgi:hypothetical protein